VTTQPALEDKTRIRLLWAGFAFLYLTLAVLLRSVHPSPDEMVHYGQINLFDHGDFRVAYKYLTMLPGYHVVMSSVLWLTDQRSLEATRLLNAIFGVLTILAFHLLRKRIWPAESSLLTLQFALLPILLPYDFLVYTDVMSLGLVLGATAATVRSRYLLAGVLMVVAMLVRQTNVIWLPLLAGIALWPIWPVPSLRVTFARTLPLAIGLALFVAYWAWNGHISLSAEQATMHPDFSLHVGNLYLALFMCAIFLPLHVLAGLRNFWSQVVSRRWLIVLPIVSIAFFLLVFHVDHPYNLVADPFLLHNFLIQQCDAHLSFKIAFGLLAVAAACGLASTPLRPGGAVLLYPLALVALSAFWMVEHRYALIPMALWLAFRQPLTRRIELATTALWLLIAVFFCLGIYFDRFTL
jgi:alpha-1,2-glucosyltransferase